MFVDESIPAAYNKVAEINNNYIVLVRESSLTSDNAYDAYVQFYYPSVQVLHLEDYKIKCGNNIIYDYDLNSSGEVISSEGYYSLECSTLDDVSSSFYDRPDAPIILWTQFLFVFMFVWIMNQMSKFIRKGGILS